MEVVTVFGRIYDRGLAEANSCCLKCHKRIIISHIDCILKAFRWGFDSQFVNKRQIGKRE